METLKILKIPTKKHKIKQRSLMDAHIIPHFPSISIFSGAAGSGKTNLVANLLSNQNMYGKSYEDYTDKQLKKNPEKKGYFDAIFLFIGSEDDMYDQLIEDGIIKSNHVCLRPTSDDVGRIIEMQNKLIKQNKGDITKVPKLLLIFDDVVNDGPFMRSIELMKVMIANRHLNVSVFFCTQYFNLVPRAIRLQANYVFIYKMNRQEIQVISDQYTPADTTKREFANLLQEATDNDGENKHNFIVIEKSASPDKKFRKNLDQYITLKRLNYVPKLDFPSTKELKDRDFDNEIIIKEINDEINFSKLNEDEKPFLGHIEYEKIKPEHSINKSINLPKPLKAKTGRPKYHVKFA